MRTFVLTLVFPALLALAFDAAAQPELEPGARFRVTVEEAGEYAPVVLPFSGEAPDRAAVATTVGGPAIPMTPVGNYAYLVVPPELGEGAHTFTIDTRRAGRKRAVTIAKRRGEDVLDVTINGEPFTSYHYSNENRKPYLWPVKAEGGVPITRDWPLGERDVSGDHPHHTSFWTGYGNLNGADYWEYGERTGWQRTESIDFGLGDAVGWITTRIVWVDKEDNPVIQEDRTYRFYATPAERRLFDVTVHFTAAYGEVTFGDTKEGGMVSLRINDGLRERGGTGTITNSAGGVGAGECWGKPAAWCDYSGTLEGVGARGVTVMDHPSSFRHPTHWHVRDYGLMGANAFGYSYFYDGEKNGDYTLPADETMTFNYRIYVHTGDVDEAQVAQYYEDYVDPPEAVWVDAR